MASNWADYVKEYGRPDAKVGSEDFDAFLLGRGVVKKPLPSRDKRQAEDLVALYQWYVDNGVSEMRAAYWAVEQDKDSRGRPKVVPRTWLDRVKACNVSFGNCVSLIVGQRRGGMGEEQAFNNLDIFIDGFEDERAKEEAEARARAAAEAAWEAARPDPGRRWARWAIIAAIIVVVIVIVVVAVVFTKDKYTPHSHPHLPAMPAMPPIPPPMSPMPPMPPPMPPMPMPPMPPSMSR